MHTLVPHQHEDGSYRRIYTSIESPSTVGGFLQKLFATDLGCGHLEKFQRSADADVDFSVAALIPAIDYLLGVMSERTFSRMAFANYVETLHSRLLLLASSQLRAPPVLR
jgi:hypothetical protein